MSYDSSLCTKARILLEKDKLYQDALILADKGTALDAPKGRIFLEGSVRQKLLCNRFLLPWNLKHFYLYSKTVLMAQAALPTIGGRGRAHTIQHV